MTDIGRHLAEPSDFASSHLSPFYRDEADELRLEDLGQRYGEDRATTVSNVMTPAIHQVPVSASVAEAARIMIEHHIHRLIVTDGKEPVGIITSMDLLRVVAEQS
jgi:CBS domain-containing protein